MNTATQNAPGQDVAAAKVAADRARIARTAGAFNCAAFPCNPRPFAAALGDLCALDGTDAIRSDTAKAILWVLIAQSYGQLATVDLCKEWDRLYQALIVPKLATGAEPEPGSLSENVATAERRAAAMGAL